MLYVSCICFWKSCTYNGHHEVHTYIKKMKNRHDNAFVESSRQNLGIRQRESYLWRYCLIDPSRRHKPHGETLYQVELSFSLVFESR